MEWAFHEYGTTPFGKGEDFEAEVFVCAEHEHSWMVLIRPDYAQ